MRFNWKQFCDDHGVRYVTHGSNVAQMHINIKCPYCGHADPSEHLGLKLDTHDPAWACWRNSQHSGRNPRRLVQKLLGCSYLASQEIVNKQMAVAPGDSDFERVATTLRPKPDSAALAHLEPPGPGLTLAFPTEFRPLWSMDRGPSKYRVKFLDYLSEDRGFGPDTGMVAEQFHLHYTLAGEFAWRVVIPFYSRSKLVGWTGRDIRKNARLRYRTCGNKQVVFNHDLALASGASTLIIVEGPFDAIKTHHYGESADCAAVATLGTAVTADQVRALKVLAQQFQQTIILLDPDQLAGGLTLAEELSVLSGSRVVSRILDQYEDPGAVPAEKMLGLCRTLSRL